MKKIGMFIFGGLLTATVAVVAHETYKILTEKEFHENDNKDNGEEKIIIFDSTNKDTESSQVKNLNPEFEVKNFTKTDNKTSFVDLTVDETNEQISEAIKSDML